MKYILVLLLGLIVGAGAAYYFFVGAPRVKQQQLGAQPLQAPESAGDPPGTVVITFDEKFFDTLLGTIFRDLAPPAFKIGGLRESQTGGGGVRFVAAQEGGGCADQISIAQEGSGARTTVSLKDGRIDVPLAFSGSRNVFGNCMNF